MKTRFQLLLFLFCFACLPNLFAQEGGPPIHMFYEIGPVGKNGVGPLATKSNRYMAAGLKLHYWKEEKPFQLAALMNWRNILIHNDLNEATSLNLYELYMGTCLLISKSKPWYPTASVLGGGYIGSASGFNAVLTLGTNYCFTPAGAKPSGIGIELVYRPAVIKYNSYTIPPTFGLRMSVFF